MSLKVSISLPGNTVITFEASEPEVFREVVGIALKELPRDLIQMQMGQTQVGQQTQLAGTISSTVSQEVETEGKNVTQVPITSEGTGDPESQPAGTGTPGQPEQGTEAEQSFARYCNALAPVGDMRRVVAAAEAARSLLGMEAVSERELARLFDLAGWHQPSDFLQTIRNAARSKFRWLERVPGSPGYYTVTEEGRSAVIGPGE